MNNKKYKVVLSWIVIITLIIAIVLPYVMMSFGK